jgi:UDP-3-O-[3-hydroxymyristoyl] glucosamine N-acyltransferase
MKVKASEIAKYLGLALLGNDLEVTKVSSVYNPLSNSLVFAQGLSDEIIDRVKNVPDVLLLGVHEYVGKVESGLLVSENVRLDFAKAANRFFVHRYPPGIASSAQVSEFVTLGKDVYIGNNCFLGRNVTVGDGTVILDGAYIGENCKIGSDCLIKSNSVIGQDGFSFEREKDGTPIRMPHFGAVVIGDFVEVGALSVIARGVFDNTVIEDHVKLDDHVFIAHNVQIGKNTYVIAGSQVSGSVKIGSNVWVSPQCTIIHHITIGDNAMIGIGSVVVKSIEEGMTAFGNPARAVLKR